MELGTSQKRVRCACPRGHVFTSLVHDSIEVGEDSSLLEALADGGMQLVRCPHCAAVWPLAEPILMHDRSGQRVALFLPEVLAHRELEVRTDVLQRLVASDLERIPLYAADFASLVGVDALERWLAAVEDSDLPRDSKPQGAVSMIPRIHSAFADLEEPERVSTTSIPPEPEEDEVEEQQDPEDDWLVDSEIESPRKGVIPSRPPAANGQVSGKGRNVDFVGMMSEDEEDDEPEEDGAFDDDTDGGDPFGFGRG